MRDNERTDNGTICFRQVREQLKEGLPIIKDTTAWSDPVTGESVGRKGIMQYCSCVDWFRKMLAPRSKMTDMVQMVVGHKDSLERIQTEPTLCQCFLEPAEAYTRIYDQTGLAV